MALFHDEDDGPDEAVPGLPAPLPEDETILWQGRADGKTLAVHAFHIRTVTLYLAIVVLVRAAFAVSSEAPMDEVLQNAGAVAFLAGTAAAILGTLGWAMARRSLFTITNKRVVIRHGVAFRKYINLPFKEIAAVDLRSHPSGYGDLALRTSPQNTVPYLHLWPFARPLRINRTVPLIRSIKNAADVASILVAAIRETASGPVRVEETTKKASLSEGMMRPEVSLS